MSENQNLVGGFELRNCVASGHSTQIWEVTEQGSTVPFAMKVLLPDALKDPEAKAVLKHEFKVGSSLEHPSFVRFHRIEMTRDHGFFIMDYFRSPSLKAQIGGNLPETQSRFKKIVEAICQAFVHMNEKGWLHRDIKPDNILVNKTGEVRIIDFSLSMKLATGVMKMISGKQKNIMGTRTYIAPETILKKTPTIQSDIYSLGVTLYEVLTGGPPFAGLSPSDLLSKHLSEAPAPPSIPNPNVTPELDSLMLRLLSKKPKDRPNDMREVMSLFRNAKCFLEDPAERHDRRTKEAKANESLSVDKRLDSRADADRVTRGLAAPEKHKKGKRLTVGMKDAPVSKPAAAPSQPVAQGQIPGMPGMMPQMPYGMPGAQMPGMMFPGMMMPQQPMMQQYPIQMPGQPMMMPGLMPQQPMPMGQPMMPQQLPVQSAPVPMASQPGQPKPAHIPAQPVNSPPAQQPTTPVEKNVLLPLERRVPVAPDPEAAADLDFMTELPDIM